MASSSSQLRSITERFFFSVFSFQNGHVQYMLSCYDAELRYDCFTDTFQARYPSHYSRTPVIEQCVHWDRIRAQPIDIPPNNVHASDCLDKLHPGDHVEIQWRRNKELPYGGGSMVLLVTWRHATRLEVSAVIINAFPEFVSSLFSRLSWPTLGGSSPSASSGNVIGNVPSYTGREVEAISALLEGFFYSPLVLYSILHGLVLCQWLSAGNYPSAAPLASTMEPSDNSIATLVSMGFDRNSARQALVQARNDVNVATNILLEAQSH
ncbi:hypothetical protein IFM89_004179 [Coptis chinensis]|uniref:UBA domain-containing protein n=1 Tax=Coptis chinensis TaxID=261450 RepID=A0A835LKG0_9MAGN|nr:hypothetical protein IFM89_004179 [Coptis chinensis]